MNKFYTIVIVGLILVLLLREGCNCSRIKKLEKDCGKVTIKEVRDTTWIKETVDVPVYVPQPGGVIYRDVPRYIEKVVDGKTVFLPVDTAAILKDYYAQVTYQDSTEFKYGKVYINDTLSQNRIQNRSVRADFNIPVETVTRTITTKPRGFLSVGVNVQGDQKEGVNMAGLSLMYTTKGRFSLEASGLYGTRGIGYGFGIKFPLSLK